VAQKAMKEACSAKPNRAAQCAAIRKIIPWKIIEYRLYKPAIDDSCYPVGHSLHIAVGRRTPASSPQLCLLTPFYSNPDKTGSAYICAQRESAATQAAPTLNMCCQQHNTTDVEHAQGSDFHWIT
jgi:hypothetical protein